MQSCCTVRDAARCGTAAGSASWRTGKRVIRENAQRMVEVIGLGSNHVVAKFRVFLLLTFYFFISKGADDKCAVHYSICVVICSCNIM